RVIILETRAQCDGLDAHDGVNAGVERIFAPKHFDADWVFFQLLSMTRHGLLNGVAKKARKPLGVDETRAGQNPVQLRVDGIRRYPACGRSCHHPNSTTIHVESRPGRPSPKRPIDSSGMRNTVRPRLAVD